MPNIGDYIYFSLVYEYLNQQINQFGLNLMTRAMTWASAIALTLVTLWIIVQGYRLLTGQSREPLMHMVLNMARIAVIVSAATTMSVVGTNLHDWLTIGLDKEVHGLFTGNGDESTAQDVDKNLAYTQVALGTIDAVQIVPGDQEMQDAKNRSLLIATFGTASPPMAAGAMLLLYQFAIALFIGLGPLFILCLLFEQTKELFRRWLLYGLGTVFSMALLSAVCAMVLGLTLKISEALWASKVINSILGNNTEGLTSQAMQQGGIGLLLTVLIISVPPMAAVFFNGTMGSFMHFSVFSGGMLSRPGPQGQPVGSYGGGYMPLTYAPNQSTGRAQNEGISAFDTHTAPPQRTLAQTSNTANQDAVKHKPRDGE
ncbi:type IV secretion system protein [Dyella sp.]|uniref:type IV secretion system protein n=1 Tax=Dyella sp. TaxID=1869338 RepID=UPI002B480B4C|nr:type IV secretion system protein [Dyella sp.]HKT29209.1 type IV secretion system protein [Dyella sp.]